MRLPSRAPASIEFVTALTDLPQIASGKVREIYDLGDELLLVASDRISTYDVVHPTPIPDKGAVLTGLSAFWFERTAGIVQNHLVSVTDGVPDEARGRAMVVRKLEMLPVECVVRGYITGSGWKDYQRTGTVSGIALPEGLRESDQLPEPIFTPSTKAEVGHDEAIDFDGAAELVGDRGMAERLRDVSIAVYSAAAAHARERGIILADTKFEFGLDSAGELTLGDEVCTPDSSRFWPADEYEPGRGQPSFDKQYVRDWASGTGWDRNPPAPAIPDEVVARTREKYVEAYERITGEPFDSWLARTRSSWPPAGTATSAGPGPGPSQGRHPRPAGTGGRAGAAGARLQRGQQRSRRAPDRARCRRSCAAAGDVRAAALEPADRGLSNRLLPGAAVKFGVVRFPGSCDDVDALQAALRVADAVMLWHADRDLPGWTRSLSPAASRMAITCAPARSRALPP